MPTKRVRQFAEELGLQVEAVIDVMEALHAANPKEFTSRHQNSNITEEGQDAVREYLAQNAAPARDDGKPELPDGPATTAMRIVDFADEIGESVDSVCAELELIGEPNHHAANISADAQDLLRDVFAGRKQLVHLEGNGEAALESDPESEVPGVLRTVEPASDVGNQPEGGSVEPAPASERPKLVLGPTPEHRLPEPGPAAEVVPAEDRFALVDGSGQATGEYELLPSDLAAVVREKLAGRKLMGFRLELHRNVAVFSTWPDGQKYEVPA